MSEVERLYGNGPSLVVLVGGSFSIIIFMSDWTEIMVIDRHAGSKLF